ncbi:hypothetical protein MKR81_05855 [Vibrio campbellii]|uniref:hypothetical protein n=1 Tax=Vibrio campbellii TaxID=680 RepID=UPI001F07E48A|nr:hypothetical protein [Vibrio campbellii]UMM04139.1 hypothetical protein MKR81_05855 [Vibrio campbellii]
MKKVNSLALKAAKKNKVSNDKKWKVTSKASVAGCSSHGQEQVTLVGVKIKVYFAN